MTQDSKTQRFQFNFKVFLVFSFVLAISRSQLLAQEIPYL
jgi:hypothetical protein